MGGKSELCPPSHIFYRSSSLHTWTMALKRRLNKFHEYRPWISWGVKPSLWLDQIKKNWTARIPSFWNPLGIWYCKYDLEWVTIYTLPVGALVWKTRLLPSIRWKSFWSGGLHGPMLIWPYHNRGEAMGLLLFCEYPLEQWFFIWWTCHHSPHHQNHPSNLSPRVVEHRKYASMF